ncbi:MAG: hypothetical protein AABZ53_05605 [Planctomycetota bacterium]
MSITDTPILPIWLVAPVAGALMLAVGGHMMTTRRSEMPESRRRIRIANAWLMVLTLPLTAYAFGVLRDTDPREFVLVWTGVAGLIGLVITVAVVDMLNTIRLTAAARHRTLSQFKEFHASLTRPRVVVTANASHPRPSAHHAHDTDSDAARS